jgi:tyrosine-protein phosphatase SIW14
MVRRGQLDGTAWLLIALVIGLGALFARYHVRDNLVPRNLGVVVPGEIYRAGRQTPAMMAAIVREHGIRTIIDLGNAPPGTPEGDRWNAIASALNVRRYAFGLFGDGTGDPNQYVAALRLMNDPANHPVLVHCAAGAQRTGACLIFQRTIREGWSVERAMGEAIGYRHDPRRNPNLRAYVEKWKDAIARALQTGETIPYDESMGFWVIDDPNE